MKLKFTRRYVNWVVKKSQEEGLCVRSYLVRSLETINGTEYGDLEMMLVDDVMMFLLEHIGMTDEPNWEKLDGFCVWYQGEYERTHTLSSVEDLVIRSFKREQELEQWEKNLVTTVIAHIFTELGLDYVNLYNMSRHGSRYIAQRLDPGLIDWVYTKTHSDRLTDLVGSVANMLWDYSYR
jgi:hypothetical protein